MNINPFVTGIEEAMKTITLNNEEVPKNENSTAQSRFERQSFQNLLSKNNSLRPRKSLLKMRSIKPLNIAPKFSTEKED
ncbi:MAG: hypothetical protein HN576_16410 [Bacteriovoracaceae bacterium]|jgi:hypothetical protein|nr:hypothetical protein [Bacteriovoracaceae bacterium]